MPVVREEEEKVPEAHPDDKKGKAHPDDTDSRKRKAEDGDDRDPSRLCLETVIEVGLSTAGLNAEDAAKKTIVYCVCLVDNQLGRIHLESAYRTALAAELVDYDFSVVEEYPVVLSYTTAKGRKIAAAKPRLDIYAVSSTGVRFLIELKHRNPSPAAEADATLQAETYRRALLPDPVHVVVVFYPKTAGHTHKLVFL